MKRKLFSSFVLVAIATTSVCLTTIAQSRSENEVFALVNRERSRAHLGSLAWDDRLASVARNYSRQMAREGFFDHYDPNGRTVIDRAQAARIRNWSSIGENLFFCDEHPYFAETAVRGWMKSRTHRTNMLDRGWTATGIGVAHGSRRQYLYYTSLHTGIGWSGE